MGVESKIFDDHEFWDNWGTRHSSQNAGDAYRVACKTYLEYQDSHNPDSLVRHKEDPPQYYYTFEYGDVGFYVLDCRTRRSPRGLPYPSILGDEQREALYKWLRDDDKRYAVKFVVSSVPITFIAIPHWLVNLLHDVLGDQWMGFRKARADLFKFIQDHNITGVHFLSGDVHLGQGVKIEPKKPGVGPTVYSYTSSPFANNFWLLPPNPPKSALGIAGVLSGFILSGLFWICRLILPLSNWGGFGETLIFLGGWQGALILAVLGAILAIRGEQMKTGKTSVRPGWFGRFIVILFSRPIDALYNLWLGAVSGDKIKAHGVDYRPSNLFPYAREINVGVVHVRRRGDSPDVCFELYDKHGRPLRQEKLPHTV